MESQKNQVTVKSAVSAAIDYIKDLYADKNLQDLLLEEVEFSKDTDQWIVTVGFSLMETKEGSTSVLMPIKSSRELSRKYKVVKIDAQTGRPISMKIRPL
jgi:hypothetical protein